MIANGSVPMTRIEADEFMRAINKQKESLVSTIRYIDRKRAWTDAQKMMETAGYRMQLESMNKLQEKIGTVFNLGGW